MNLCCKQVDIGRAEMCLKKNKEVLLLVEGTLMFVTSLMLI